MAAAAGRSLVGSTLISIRQTDVDRLIGRLALVTGTLLFCCANKVPLGIKKWRERCLRSPSSLFFTEAIFSGARPPARPPVHTLHLS